MEAVAVAIDGTWVRFLLVNNHTWDVHPLPTVDDSIEYWTIQYDGSVSHTWMWIWMLYRERSLTHFHGPGVELVRYTDDVTGGVTGGMRWE